MRLGLLLHPAEPRRHIGIALGHRRNGVVGIEPRSEVRRKVASAPGVRIRSAFRICVCDPETEDGTAENSGWRSVPLPRRFGPPCHGILSSGGGTRTPLWRSRLLSIGSLLHDGTAAVAAKPSRDRADVRVPRSELGGYATRPIRHSRPSDWFAIYICDGHRG